MRSVRMEMQRNLCSRKWISLIFRTTGLLSSMLATSMRTKYLAFADWEDALNPARKNSSGCYTNIEIIKRTDFPSITDDIFGITILPAFR